MAKDDIYAKLNSLFRDVFMDEDIVLRPDMTAADIPGWDSFKQVEILIAVQEVFRVKLSSKEMDGLKSVGDLAEVVERRLTN